MKLRNAQKHLATSLLLFGLLIGWSGEAFCANCGATISGPCTIASAGGYTLSGNVSQGTANTDALPFANSVNDVTVNLTGWTVTGGSGTGQGINACAGATCGENTTVTNGHVKASGQYAIDLDNNEDVEQVQTYQNGNNGIWPSNTGIVYQTINYNNSGDGINTSSNNSIMQNVSASNTSNGITTGTGGLVADNASSSNTSTGLSAGTDTGYGRNVLGGNTTCISGGKSMSDNVCSGTKQ